MYISHEVGNLAGGRGRGAFFFLHFHIYKDEFSFKVSQEN